MDERQKQLGSILDALTPAIYAAVAATDDRPAFGFALIVFEPVLPAGAREGLSALMSNSPKPLLAEVMRVQADWVGAEVAAAAAGIADAE